MLVFISKPSTLNIIVEIGFYELEINISHKLFIIGLMKISETSAVRGNVNE